MREEVFGPILPVLDYADTGEAIATVEANAPRPLALYLFSGSRKVQRRVLGSLEFGNGCINDAMSQIIGPNVPFGGVGASGMGCYHGKEGFLTFSRKRGMVRKPTIVDPPLRYPPYGRLKEKLVRWLS
jgi:aldehyde dehydrogenase (NAD+)